MDNIYLALNGQITNKYDHHGQYKNETRHDELKWKFKNCKYEKKITSIFFLRTNIKAINLINMYIQI